VVLLAHNDVAHLEDLVSGWVTHLAGLGRDHEVVLVDDGSADGTGELAEKLADRHGCLRVLRLPAPRGEGAALRAALAVTQYPLLLYAPCRPGYQPADLDRLLTRPSGQGPGLEIDQVHLMTGYRAGTPVPAGWRLAGFLWRGFCRVVFNYSPPRLPGWLGWQGHAARLLARALFGLRYHDVACPFRLQRRSIFARIPLQSDGPFVHVEILAKANFLGHVMGGEEVPLAASPEPGRQPGGSLRQWTAECFRVFAHPDFGPAVLPPPEGGSETPSPPGAGPADAERTESAPVPDSPVPDAP
jgi:hypothetical protein